MPFHAYIVCQKQVKLKYHPKFSGTDMGEVIKVIFCRFPHVSQKAIGKINGRGTALHKKCTYLTKPNHMSVAYYLKNKSISNVLIVVGHSKPTTARGIGR